jgi:hypothetical protein
MSTVKPLSDALRELAVVDGRSELTPLDSATVSKALSAGCDGCLTCPFSVNEWAEQAQNYGCLPTNIQILDMARAAGRPWGCHYDESRVCKGYASVAKLIGFPVSGAPLSYSAWYHDGVAI